jgi:WD40 repeat protein
MTIRVWDISTGQVDRTLEDYSDWVTSVAFSSDGSKPYPLYSVSESGLWVRQNRLSVLYLPFDFREGVMASKGDSLAIGTRTGRVVIITFDSDFNAETI